MNDTSKKINPNANTNAIGIRGANSVAKLVSPNENHLLATFDEDHDGKADYGVSRELSEESDRNVRK